MTTRDLVNHILLTGQKGYKDMEDGNRISDKMTLLVKEHIKAEAEKMVSERMKKVESLLNMAAGLVGNPCTNISSSCDIACDDWQGEYNEYLKSKEK